MFIPAADFRVPASAMGEVSVEASLRKAEEVFITDIELARDDGGGRHGQVVRNFRRTDNPLHCVVTLSRARGGTRVRFVWIAVEAGGTRENVLADAESVTGAREMVVDGVMSLPRQWPAGRYRVQATVNNRTSKTVEFNVE